MRATCPCLLHCEHCVCHMLKLRHYEDLIDIDFEAAFEATDYSVCTLDPALPKSSRRRAKKSPQIKNSKARSRAREARERRRQKCIHILKEKDRKYSRDERFNRLGELLWVDLHQSERELERERELELEDRGGMWEE